LLNIMLFIT